MASQEDSQVERPLPSAVRWYQPLLAAVRLVGPLGIFLYAVDGHSFRDFFTTHFLRFLLAGILAGGVVLYVAVGLTRWRRR